MIKMSFSKTKSPLKKPTRHGGNVTEKKEDRKTVCLQ